MAFWRRKQEVEDDIDTEQPALPAQGESGAAPKSDAKAQADADRAKIEALMAEAAAVNAEAEAEAKPTAKPKAAPARVATPTPPSDGNFIAEDTTIVGDYKTASALTLAGSINGDVTTTDNLFLLEDSEIKGNVAAKDLNVGGKIEGTITTSGKLTIGPKGMVVGDVTVRVLHIEDGGVLDGRCKMSRS